MINRWIFKWMRSTLISIWYRLIKFMNKTYRAIRVTSSVLSARSFAGHSRYSHSRYVIMPTLLHFKVYFLCAMCIASNHCVALFIRVHNVLLAPSIGLAQWTTGKGNFSTYCVSWVFEMPQMVRLALVYGIHYETFTE